MADVPVTHVVVNPASGGGRAALLLDRVTDRLASTGHGDVRVHRTQHWSDAVVGTRAARGADALVVIGGDGMAHLGVNACAGTDTTLAIVPGGTGNDIARGIGLDAKHPLQAVDALLAGHTRRIDALDLGEPGSDAPTEGNESSGLQAGRGAPASSSEAGFPPAAQRQRYVGSVLCTGFDAIVNQRANQMTRAQGSLRYLLAVIAELPSFAPLPYTLTIDGKARELEAMLVAVGNTACYGGGVRICPAADPGDGLADVTIIHAASRTLLLRLLPQLYTGRFARHRVVEQVRCTSITVAGQRITAQGTDLGPLAAMGDGEPAGSAPVTATVTPSAVTVAVPT